MAMFGEVSRHLLRKRATILYPFKERELVPLPKGYRGKISFNRDLCVGCTLCAKDCPSNACEITKDERGNRPVFHLDRCCFCGQCEETCPRRAITLTTEFELAAYDRSALVVR